MSDPITQLFNLIADKLLQDPLIADKLLQDPSACRENLIADVRKEITKKPELKTALFGRSQNISGNESQGIQVDIYEDGRVFINGVNIFFPPDLDKDTLKVLVDNLRNLLEEVLKSLLQPSLPALRQPSLLARTNPFQVPPLPKAFVARREPLEALKTLILDRDKPPDTFVVSAIRGMGGIGKSVLASALARDTEIRQRFPDGIIWVPLGQTPDLLPLLEAVIRDGLGDYIFKPTSLGMASTRISHHSRSPALNNAMLPSPR
jgi:hypothetical protein